MNDTMGIRTVSANSRQLDWYTYQALVERLADKVNDKWPNRFKRLIGVTRGGLVGTAILAYKLNIVYVDTLGLSRYTKDNQPGPLTVIKNPSESVVKDRGRDTLAFDDLVDWGDSLALARQILPEATFVSVFSKPAGAPQVDLCVEEVPQDPWIYHPWEWMLGS